MLLHPLLVRLLLRLLVASSCPLLRLLLSPPLLSILFIPVPGHNGSIQNGLLGQTLSHGSLETLSVYLTIGVANG
jgi:hypothetical protein